MSRARSVVAAVGAIVGMLAIAVGVPVLLVVAVGNPWPGRARLELRDEVAIVVGALTVVAWLVWARFVAAMVVEVLQQLRELRAFAAAGGRAGHVALVPPPSSRQGIGLLAQRLVATVLVVLPVATKMTPTVADGPAPLKAERAVATVVHDVASSATGLPRPTTRADRAVTVETGDTLLGLARVHLGDAQRWREIYELNRDRVQPDGHRLASPSGLRAGWRLALPDTVVLPPAPIHQPVPAEPAPAPAAPPAPYLAPATITVEPGDNLWELTEERLESAGAAADAGAVADHLRLVIELNPDVVEDPNLIYVGEQFAFPAVGTPPPPPPPPVEAAPAPLEPPPAQPATVEVVPVELADDAVPAPPEARPPTTTTPPSPPPPPAEEPALVARGAVEPVAPIGIGQAALLSAGVLALVAARRRLRLRASQPRARLPEPPPETVATERRLRTVGVDERLLRIDVAVRAAAASLVDGDVRLLAIRAGSDGTVELTLSGGAALPGPWEGNGACWTLSASTPIELLADPARSVGAPCVALTQIGVDADGADVLVDLEALGLLAVVAPEAPADAVVQGIAATLGTSIFSEVANLVGVGLDGEAFLEHRQAHHVASVDEGLELATTLIGTTASARQSTFVLRSRHTSGEAWEPAVVLTASAVQDQVTAAVVEAAARRRGGLAMVSAGDITGAPWALRADRGVWVLDPLGWTLVPVGLSVDELHELHDVLTQADAPLIDGEVAAEELVAEPSPGGPFDEPSWSLLVRMLGPVEVVDRSDRSARFERSKTLELIAWLSLHRDRSTRAGARTALWDLDVRDATFANIVSEARRAMARHVEPPAGEEWLARTLTEVLPLHPGVVADVDLVRARLDHARLQPPELAIETLRPAVELIRDLPFAGTGYLWPDAEGLTSNLVLLATSAATELAGHHLSMGDIDGVFWATGQGLKVLPGHEELIALRMRAHARAGDLSGVRLEWESYERVLDADPWSDGEPAPKLVLLRRELLSS